MKELSFDANISSREDQHLGIKLVEETMKELSFDVNISSREDQPAPQFNSKNQRHETREQENHE